MNQKALSPSTSIDMQRANRRHECGQFPNLDLLRAFAVLAVFVDHLLWINGIDKVGWLSVDALGRAGVLAFFAHTSCVLMFSAERLDLRGAPLYGSFILRRIFRIYPLSIATVLFVTIFRVPAYPSPGSAWEWLGWSPVLASIFLIQNITLGGQVLDPLWSLPYEVQMYCVLPVLYEAVRFKGGRIWGILALCSCGILVLLWLKQTNASIPLRGLNILEFCPCFLCGILCWIRIKTIVPRWHGNWWAVWVFVLIAGYGFARYTTSLSARSSSEYIRMAAEWMFCGLLAVTYSLFDECNLDILKKGAHEVAKYSYGIYLSHFPIFWVCFVKLRSQPMALQWVLMGVLSIVVPVIAFHILERPLIMAGRNLADRWFRSAGMRRAGRLSIGADGQCVLDLRPK